MALEADGKDFIIQAVGPDNHWRNVEHYESPYSAKQNALAMLHSHVSDAVRVVQVVLVGSQSGGQFHHQDIIGDESDRG